MSSIIAARAGNHFQVSDYENGLTVEQIQHAAPSVFAIEPHSSRSERYQHISTAQVMGALMDEGFIPVVAAQAKVQAKRIDKIGHTKHMLRFRHPSLAVSSTADYCPEVIVCNSHDGTSSYQIFGGAFRFICMNGMVLGRVMDNHRILHKANVQDAVVNAAFSVIETVKVKATVIEEMANTEMPVSDRLRFARLAREVRFGDKASTISDNDVLQARRTEDAPNTQWCVYNRVQENIIRGGMDATRANGKRRRVRALSGLAKDIDINARLWDIMMQVRGDSGSMLAPPAPETIAA